MFDALKEESIGFLFNVQAEPAPQTTVAPVAASAGLLRGQEDGEPTVRATWINDQDDATVDLQHGPAEDGGVEVATHGPAVPRLPGSRREAARPSGRSRRAAGRSSAERSNPGPVVPDAQPIVQSHQLPAWFGRCLEQFIPAGDRADPGSPGSNSLPLLRPSPGGR